MKIECPQCWVAYHLYHDGMEMKVLRGYFLRANWQISGEHPKHNPVVVLENFQPQLKRRRHRRRAVWDAAIFVSISKSVPCSFCKVPAPMTAGCP